MPEAPGVAQLVDAFLEGTSTIQVRILRQSVERGSQARQGDKGIAPVERRLAKDKVEAGRRAVGLGQPQQPPGVGIGDPRAQGIEDGPAIVLTAAGMVGALRQGDLVPHDHHLP